MIPVSRSSPVTVVVISGKVFIPALGPLIIKGAGASPEVGIPGPAQTSSRSDVEATYALREWLDHAASACPSAQALGS